MYGQVPYPGQIVAQADFSKGVARCNNMVITQTKGFEYNARFPSLYGGTWRVYSRQGGFFGSFRVPYTSWYELVVVHGASYDDGNHQPGYSPITISVNKDTVVTDYDPGANHPQYEGSNEDLPTDIWPIFAHAGHNTFSVNIGNGARTHYWIHNLQIRVPAKRDSLSRTRQGELVTSFLSLFDVPNSKGYLMPAIVAALLGLCPTLAVSLLPTILAYWMRQPSRYVILWLNVPASVIFLLFLVNRASDWSFAGWQLIWCTLAFVVSGAVLSPSCEENDMAAAQWQKMMTARFNGRRCWRRTILAWVGCLAASAVMLANIAELIYYGTLHPSSYYSPPVLASLPRYASPTTQNACFVAALVGLFASIALVFSGLLRSCDRCHAWWAYQEVDGSSGPSWTKVETVSRSREVDTHRFDPETGKRITFTEHYTVNVLATYRDVTVWYYCTCCGASGRSPEKRREGEQELP